MIKKPIEILCLMTVTWVYEWQMDIGHWTALVSKGSKLSWSGLNFKEERKS